MFKIRADRSETVQIKGHTRNVGLALDDYGNVYSAKMSSGASNKKIIESLRKTRY